MINIFLKGLVAILSCEVLSEVTGIGCGPSLGLGGAVSQVEREEEDRLKEGNMRLPSHLNVEFDLVTKMLKQFIQELSICSIQC